MTAKKTKKRMNITNQKTKTLFMKIPTLKLHKRVKNVKEIDILKTWACNSLDKHQN